MHSLDGKRVKSGYNWYLIREIERLEDNARLMRGQCLNQECEIHLNRDYGPTERLATFFHELFHTWEWQFRKEFEEEEFEFLSTMFALFLVDNPDFVVRDLLPLVQDAREYPECPKE